EEESVAGIHPGQRGKLHVRTASVVRANTLQKIVCRKYSVGANEPGHLRQQRDKRDEINQRQAAKEDGTSHVMTVPAVYEGVNKFLPLTVHGCDLVVSSTGTDQLRRNRYARSCRRRCIRRACFRRPYRPGSGAEPHEQDRGDRPDARYPFG